MKLPDGVEHVRTTPTFDESTVPAGLLAAHRVGDSVWGVAAIASGSLDFVFEDEPASPIRLVAGDRHVIPPGRLHHVSLTGPVTFAVEFFR